ncbi:MAG: hypothetical protein ACREBR_05390 [bacterium]
MGLFRKPVKQDFPELPDSLYFARLAKIANKVGLKSGKPYISWGFEIVQPPHQKRWVWANTQPTVGPKSQTGKFLTALGLDISTIDPETFNEQNLVGKYIKVLVETTESEDGAIYQNVTKLMGIDDSEQPLLQTWLAALKVKGPVQVVSHATVPNQQPVLAAAPVSLPAAPAGFPGFTVTPTPPVQAAPAPVAPIVSAPVVAPTPAPAVATGSKPKFPF